LVPDVVVLVFCFQAEDGIRDRNVTGVQTCALPISIASISASPMPRVVTAGVPMRRPEVTKGEAGSFGTVFLLAVMRTSSRRASKIGRASCREGAEGVGGAGGRYEQAQGERVRDGRE